MILENKYAISIKFPQAFDELLYRVTKWRQTRDSFFALTYSIKPYQIIALNTETSQNETVTFQEVIKSTIKTLYAVEHFFEEASSYNPVYVTSESEHSAHAVISTDEPLTEPAGENISFDIDNLHKGIIQILKTYGQFDKKSGLWVMNSREDAFRAYDLLLNDYPIFVQLISNFAYPNPSLPTIVQSTSQSVATPEIIDENTTPIMKMIYDKGLDILLNPKSNMFKEDDEELALGSLSSVGEFQILYCTLGDATENPNEEPTVNKEVVLDPVTNIEQSLVIDENNYNTWVYPPEV